MTTLDIMKEKDVWRAPLKMTQGETGTAMAYQLVENGVPINLAGKTVRFLAILPDGHIVIDDATIVTAASGEVSYVTAPALASVCGMIRTAYFAIYEGDVRISTTGDIGIVVSRGVDIDDREAGDYVPTFNQMLALEADIEQAESTRQSQFTASTTACSTATANASTAASTAESATTACIAATTAANALLDESTITADDIRNMVYTRMPYGSGGSMQIDRSDIADMVYGQLGGN